MAKAEIRLPTSWKQSSASFCVVSLFFPRVARPRPGLGLEIRSAAVKPYVVLHRYDRAADTVFILRVLHGRRQITLDAP